MKEGKNMTLKEFVELVKYINDNHSMRNMEGKCIKYITPTFDFRTNEIYGIKIWGGVHEKKEFYVVNENKDKDLKQWIYKWLSE